MKELDVNKLLDISIALSSEKNIDLLLELILDAAMDITDCDGGTLYICKAETLEFRLMVTKSLGIRDSEGGTMPPVPMNKEYVCARAAIEKEIINILDIYLSGKSNFSGTKQYDEMTGYRTVSMLVIPMEDDYGEVIGVMQLINAKDSENHSIPFAVEYERIVSALASQAAISLTNRMLSKEIETQLHSFVQVMSTAIDARSPYNANHTRNMVCYADRFIEWLGKNGCDWQQPQNEPQ